jgi:hypothetical protein
LQLKPDSAALLNNYAMSRMLAGDLPGAQTLIAQAQAAGNDPKIAHNAALMMNLRNARAEQTAAVRPLPAPVVAPVVQTANAKPAAIEPKPVASIAPVPVAHALPKPVATAALPPPAPIKPVPVKPEPVKAAAVVAKPVPTMAASIPVKPEPVKTAAIVAKPEPIKTAAIAVSEKPTIVKTQTGSVMMQAVPKDSEAGPVKAAEPVKSEAAATTAPRTLASAAPMAPVEAPRTTPDLRAASD